MLSSLMVLGLQALQPSSREHCLEIQHEQKASGDLAESVIFDPVVWGWDPRFYIFSKLSGNVNSILSYNIKEILNAQVLPLSF